MLKYKNEIIPDTEDVAIDLKGRIYNVKTNETIKTRICRGREFYKRYGVHTIQVSSNSNAWFPGCDVHHLDKNPLNNALSNLVCLSKSEHISLHTKSKPKSDEARQNMSDAHKGQHAWNRGISCSEEQKKKQSDAIKGRKWWNNGIKETRAFKCPEGFVSGRLKKS